MSKLSAYIIATVIVAPIMIAAIAYYAIATWLLWGWFIVPLGAKPISWPHAAGLTLFFSAFLQVQKDYKIEYDKEGYVIAMFTKPTFLIVIGYIVNLFMY